MKKGYAAAALLLALTGCETLPTGPSVMVLPSPGKPFDQFQGEDAICRQYADRQVRNPQEAYNENATKSAVVGTAVGTGVGALLGAATGHAGAGAAIGAGGGLLVGSASGAQAGEVHGRDAQRRYDNTYLQCMYSYGNQIPGTARRSRRTRGYAPPPPDQEYYRYPPPDQPPPR